MLKSTSKGKSKVNSKGREGKKSRRWFLKSSGIVLGSSVIGIYFGRDFLRRKATEFAGEFYSPSGVSEFRPDIWFEIMAENRIKLHSPKMEMGQGVFTGLAMMAAEELEVDLALIEVVPASTLLGLSDMLGTGGSSSTAALFIPLRETAATMREMLRIAAAKKWSVSLDSVSVRNGILTSGSNESTYYEVSQSQTEWEIPDAPKLKDSSSFKIIGTHRKRVDLEPKVMGEPIFGIDQSLPGMLYTTVLRSPFLGAKRGTTDIAAAKAFPGVLRILVIEEMMAVVAETRYAAEMGLRKLNAQWDIDTKWEQADIDTLMSEGTGTMVTIQKEGSIDALEENESLIEQEYRTPAAAHAQIEPNGTIAHVTEDHALIITGTQNPNYVLGEVADALDMDKDNVEIRPAHIGGGFGRRFFLSTSVDAAMISKEMNAPVQLFRTREEEFFNGYHRPPTRHRLSAVLSEDGNVEAINHLLVSGDMVLKALGSIATTVLGADTFSAGHGARFMYSFENRHARMRQEYMPYSTGIWRGVGMFANSFAVESFMDELALKAGRDPLQFRLDYLTEDKPRVRRMRKVLERLRDECDWAGSAQEGVGRGIACAEDRGTVVAAYIEVYRKSGDIKVKKILQVIDPGVSINPEGIRTQVEGASMMGLSATLYESLSVRDGSMSASNYHQYPMARLSDTPEDIRTVIVEGSERPYGVGEPPIAVISPAIANAMFDLTGDRKRSLPLLG